MSGLLLPNRPVPIESIPDIAAAVRALGFQTEDEGARLDALVNAQWVLVRIDGEGERWRCNRCNAKHTHFTLMCIERPFRGLTQGLHAYWQNVGAANLNDLSPAQRKRVASISPRLGGPTNVIGVDGKPMPTLASRHPEMARKLATPESDIDIGAWVLGTVEQISPLDASVLIERINHRSGRTVIRF